MSTIACIIVTITLIGGKFTDLNHTNTSMKKELSEIIKVNQVQYRSDARYSLICLSLATNAFIAGNEYV